MPDDAFRSAALDGLSSAGSLELLDSIDMLRSQDISHDVSLPQIIVCGDQSSGKSAVLEAISGIPFPVKGNLCTRFATEIVLRRTPQVEVSVSIVAHESHSEAEQITLDKFQESLDGFDGLPALIEAAKAAMGVEAPGRAFSKDVLRVEVSGPDQPHLAIVDLPGLIRSHNEQQSVADIDLVREVVQNYMKEPRSIILAVVAADDESVNHTVLKLARAADEDGHRSMGVITKPDTLVPGSEKEAMYVSLAKNQDIEFRLGWHVLRNMDSELGRLSLADRDKTENDFFSQGIWQKLSPLHLGVSKLRSRLSTVLLGQFTTGLPSLIQEIDIKAGACRSQLAILGAPRPTLREQRLYLLRVSQSFQSLVKSSVDGTYNDRFFSYADLESGYQKRIRARVQNLNTDFAKEIASRGYYRHIVESDTATVSSDVLPVPREEFLDRVEKLMERTRGRELPGTFNPMIVADLFYEQSIPWREITKEHIGNVWGATKTFVSHLSVSLTKAEIQEALFQKVLEPALNQLLDTMNRKTQELLGVHREIHPITYNRRFIEVLQKVRKERSTDECTRILKDFLGAKNLATVYPRVPTSDFAPLVPTLVKITAPDLNRSAASEALDCMQAYYEIALERFVDAVAIEVIEVNLLSKISGIFSPLTVDSLADDVVTSISGESEENRNQREQLTVQLDVLNKGSEICKRFVDVQVQGAETAFNRLSLTSKSPLPDPAKPDDEPDNSDNGGRASLPNGVISEKPDELVG